MWANINRSWNGMRVISKERRRQDKSQILHQGREPQHPEPEEECIVDMNTFLYEVAPQMFSENSLAQN